MEMQANKVGIDVAQRIIARKWDKAREKGVVAKPIMIHGSMGLGKSSIVHQYANANGYRVVDLRGTGMEAPDVLGLGYVDHASGELKFSTPEWWPTHDNEKVIIFLDELTNCTKSVQQAFYRLVLDRQIQNGKKLPNSAIIVGAGNLVADGTGAKPLLPALANRFSLHLFIDKDKAPSAFLKWGVKNGIHNDVLAFIAYSPTSLIEKAVSGPFCTPRTWEETSEHIFDVPDNDDDLRILISGVIGTDQCIKFMGWRKFNDILPNWQEIINGAEYKMPDDNEARWNVAAHLALHCIKHHNDETAFLRLFAIANQLDKECLVVFFRLLKSDMDAFVEIIDYDDVHTLFNKIEHAVR